MLATATDGDANALVAQFFLLLFVAVISMRIDVGATVGMRETVRMGQ